MIGLIAAYLIVLAAKPTWTALATIGPNPSEGGRFYGSSNLTTSILLTVALFAAGVLGRGGVIPDCAALHRDGRLEPGGSGRRRHRRPRRRVRCALDPALERPTDGARPRDRRSAGRRRRARPRRARRGTGGSSHVTRKVGDGPIPLLDELGDRLYISIDRLTTSWHAALVFAIAIAALFTLFTRPPRFAVGDALMVGIAVSLLLNDTPQHVAAAGAVSYGVLWAHERVTLSIRCRDVRLGPDRRLSAIAAALLVGVGVAAGCGYEGQTGATPETVEGGVPTSTTETTETTPTPPAPAGDAAAGKAVFTTNCGGCHTL